MRTSEAAVADAPFTSGPPEAVKDALWGGRLTLWQPARGAGYRFNLDPILLSNFLPCANHLVDLGAGVGIIGLLALALGRAKKVTAVERQVALACLIRRNSLAQGVAKSVSVVTGDLRSVATPQAPDLVAFNPPYFTAREGRPCQEPGRDAGRREVHGTLQDFVHFGATATRAQRGKLAAIIPWSRKDEIEKLVTREGMHLARTRPVCARADKGPGHLLILASHCSTTLEAMRPLYVHREDGSGYTIEIQSWLDGPSLGAGGLS